MQDREGVPQVGFLMSPSRYAPFDTRSDVVAAARDDKHRLLWCNASYASTIGADPDKLKGSNLHSIFAAPFADERQALVAPAIERQQTVTYDQVVRGTRYLTRIYPLDPQEFGSSGYFVLAEPCAAAAPLLNGHKLNSARHGDLGDLSALTRRELEIFRLLAEGLTGAEIATTLHRSPKTVEFHTARILHALTLRNRTELARLAAERGLLGFTREAWFQVAQGRSASSRRTGSLVAAQLKSA